MTLALAATGLTSGVGMRLAEVARERGLALAGLVRDLDRDDARRLASLGVRLVQGDLGDRAALGEVARGAGAFVHMAAHVGDWGPRAEFERVNVEGTRNALEAAAAAGVRRFVHLSSTSVYGRPDRGRVTEAWPRERSGQAYDDTKTDAEVLAFERGHALGLEVAAIRPPIIYGPYDRNFMPRAVDTIARGRMLLIDGGRAPLNLVWADHVVDVLLLAAEAPAAAVAGEAFNVMDGVSETPASVREVMETLARAAGLPPPTRSVPYPIALGIGHALWNAFRLAGASKAPPVTPFVVKLMSRHVVYDAGKAARVLGWKPRIGSLEGVARYAKAFRKVG